MGSHILPGITDKHRQISYSIVLFKANLTSVKTIKFASTELLPLSKAAVKYKCINIRSLDHLLTVNDYLSHKSNVVPACIMVPI
uniref:Uncharacterized protein n=1 Tax=Arion vulgaris TaxID=1028688 RepID=A0A0B7AD68_9EUPU